MEKNLASFYSRIGRCEKAAFFSVLIFGFITHVHIFSVNYIYHDAVKIDNLGSTYVSGRWMLGFIEDFSAQLLGIYQLPFINGFISLFLIAITTALIVNAFEIKSSVTAAFIGAVIVSFPSVASHFAFMFTATSYFFSFLLSVFSVYLFHKRPSVVNFIISAVLICIALGIYQAYLCFAISFALSLVMILGLRHRLSFAQLLKKGILFVLLLLTGLALYLAVNKLILAVKGLELVNYQGLNKMGQIDLVSLPQAIIQAYSDQLQPSWQGIITCYFEKRLTWLVNLFSILLFLRLIRLSSANISAKLLLFFIGLIAPIAFNSIYLMAPDSLSMSGVHSLMRMSLVFTYILPAVFCEMLSEHVQEKSRPRLDFAVLAISGLLLVLVPLTYCYRDNTAYLNAELVEEQAEAYYGSMVTRIRSLEGYKDELPVAYVGFGVRDSTIAKLPMHGKSYTFVFSLSLEELIANTPWREFCALHLGWSPAEVEDISHYRELEQVRQMPCYPDDGSIQIIDEAIVVKFSD